jgi:hypothetical protein
MDPSDSDRELGGAKPPTSAVADLSSTCFRILSVRGMFFLFSWLRESSEAFLRVSSDGIDRPVENLELQQWPLLY